MIILVLFSVRQVKTDLEDRGARLEDLVSDITTSHHQLEMVEDTWTSLLKEQSEMINSKHKEIKELMVKLRQDQTLLRF